MKRRPKNVSREAEEATMAKMREAVAELTGPDCTCCGPKFPVCEKRSHKS